MPGIAKGFAIGGVCGGFPCTGIPGTGTPGEGGTRRASAGRPGGGASPPEDWPGGPTGGEGAVGGCAGRCIEVPACSPSASCSITMS